MADDATDPQACVAYLDYVSALPSIRAYKRRTFDVLRLQPGAHVLEVGCGTGVDAVELARFVGPGGRVLGVDSSEVMVTEALRRRPEDGQVVEYRLADAHSLPLPADSFDGCRADRVFQHLHSPEQALAEMIRVTRPGGWVAVSDTDWGTLVVDASDVETTRRVAHFCGGLATHAYIGRRLPGMVKRSGLHAVGFEALPIVFDNLTDAQRVLGLGTVARMAAAAGVISAEAMRAWVSDLEEAAAEGRFFCAICGFLAYGRKP
ncbi:MAG: methyltransferase domain-containing protein [Armatimonadota bacterium]|nr:methyltransferase domain-containing protein [Armatimonadota bacterium]